MPVSLADSYQNCPGCGRPTPTPGVNPFRCDDDGCGFTFYFSPITAVAGIVADPNGRVLFLKRAKDPGKGKLGLPGGFVDSGESLEGALRREVLEETGLTVTFLNYIVSFPNVYEYKGIALDVTDMFFHCEVESLKTLSAQEGEVTGFHLVTPTETDLANMAFDSNRKALRMYLEQKSSDG